ncbi:hypothetical protein [Cerasicoccus arenae]|nr:hypothetical protein [Cerasicoccus arenae]MBK1857460.1 hypothetical protein [Cerasicoccus arenae]
MVYNLIVTGVLPDEYLHFDFPGEHSLAKYIERRYEKCHVKHSDGFSTTLEGC